jgi:putative ABC transport system permease protein
MRFLTFVFKNLARRRGRTVLTVVGLAVAVGAVVALVGIAHGFERSFIDLFRGHGVDMVVVRSGVVDASMSSLDERLGERLRGVPGVRSVSPVLMEAVSFPEHNLFTVGVQGIDPASDWMNDYRMLAGRRLVPGDGRVVLLGRLLAQNLGQGVGDEVEILEGERFRVVGVFDGFSVYENGALTVPVGELQELMDKQGQVTWFHVGLKDATDAAATEAVARAIKQFDPTLEALPTATYVETDARLQAARAMAWLTSAIALVIGGVGMLNTMIMSVFERTHEIGILRAIGWKKMRVVRMIVLEAMLLSVAGALLGTVGAVVLTRLLSRLPEVSGIVGESIEPRVIAQGMAIALLVGLFGAAYPAWRGARLLPTEALRHE